MFHASFIHHVLFHFCDKSMLTYIAEVYDRSEITLFLLNNNK